MGGGGAAVCETGMGEECEPKDSHEQRSSMNWQGSKMENAEQSVTKNNVYTMNECKVAAVRVAAKSS